MVWPRSPVRIARKAPTFCGGLRTRVGAIAVRFARRFRQSGNPGHQFGAAAGAVVTPVTVPAAAGA